MLIYPISDLCHDACSHGRREINMGKLEPSLTNETESLKAAYTALNRNDIPAFLNALDPQIEFN